MNSQQNLKQNGSRAPLASTHSVPDSPSFAAGATHAAIRSRACWLICSNSNHVKIFTPIARELKARGWNVRFVSLDNFYGQGASEALRRPGFERLEVPTRTPDGDWHERTYEQRLNWNAEAVLAVRGMFDIHPPQAVLAANDTGFLEQLFIRAAAARGIRTLLMQEGALAALDHANLSERPVVMGDGGCDVICTWGEGFARRLRERGVSGRVFVTGHPVFDMPVPPRPARDPGLPPTVLLVGQCFGKYGILSPEREKALYEHLVRLLVDREGIRLVFKLHPQHDPQAYADLHARLGRRFELIHGGDSLASIQAADLMVSINSTMGIEAYRLGVPLLALHYLSTVRVPDLEMLPGACWSEAEFLRHLDAPESWAALRCNAAGDDPVLRDALFKLDGKSSQRVVDALEAVVNCAPATVPAPKISLVVSAHANGQVLESAVRNSLHGSDAAVEVVIVETAEFAKGISLTDERLRVVRGSKPSDALLEAVRSCRGEIVVRLSGEAHALAGWHRSIAATFEQRAGAALVLGSRYVLDEWKNFEKVRPCTSSDLTEPLAYGFRREKALEILIRLDRARRTDAGLIAELSRDGETIHLLAGLCAGAGAVKSAQAPAPAAAPRPNRPSRAFKMDIKPAGDAGRKEQDTPDVSVILCSYNRAATLVRCLERFCNQTLPRDQRSDVPVRGNCV